MSRYSSSATKQQQAPQPSSHHAERIQQENADRLAVQVQRHISTLRNLRSKLEEPRDGDLGAPSEHHGMRSIFLGEVEGENYSNGSNGHSNSNSNSKIKPILKKDGLSRLSSGALSMGGGVGFDDNNGGGGIGFVKGGNGQSSQELHSVLEGLNRLEEIQSRIAYLEKGPNRHMADVREEVRYHGGRLYVR
jgi:hypothetical protein